MAIDSVVRRASKMDVRANVRHVVGLGELQDEAAGGVLEAGAIRSRCRIRWSSSNFAACLPMHAKAVVAVEEDDRGGPHVVGRGVQERAHPLEDARDALCVPHLPWCREAERSLRLG